ncbi:MAG: YgiQ family radical SAM protein [Deltaproteobacteria bacterium]|nr:YgiQ family radical SAM protein [Deltaproteobacteria bacterium]
MRARGWDSVDVVFVTGDAYIDHPSFAMALLGRVLEAAGYRVAILAQPAWDSVLSFLEFGAPRLFWAVSAGNMDSMINHYTARKKVRNADAYSSGGTIGRRPDRATNVYVQRCREANKRLDSRAPVVAGGVEASLRRLAHYDYWSDTVRPSILQSSKADLVVHGMGEAPVLEIARRLADGETVRDLRDMRSVAWLAGKKEQESLPWDTAVVLPSFEHVKGDKREFARATWMYHGEMNPMGGRVLLQAHGDRVVVCNPAAPPLSEAEMDRIYDLPYARRSHPSYDKPVPAFATIKDSVTIMRGCFGGCTFCSITMHQGNAIQSRSEKSVLRELRAMGKTKGFKGTVSDLGGPTANMYKMRCTKPEVEAICRRPSCVHPNRCKLLGTDHGPLVQLMRKARDVKGIKKINIASGVRMDLAKESPQYLDELVRHHVGGHLKVAPEHASDRVLKVMRKPDVDDFEQFGRAFAKASKRAGKEQYLVPYFISSHPGADVSDAIELAVFLKKSGYRPQQVQDFIPAPMDVATAIYWTGLDPKTLTPMPVAKKLRDRNLQRALLQFFKPENWFEVRDALVAAGRKDLIGEGPTCLIRAYPTEAAKQRRRQEAGGGSRGGGGGSRGGRSGSRGGRGGAKHGGYRPKRGGRRGDK